jgi:protease YdgD
MALICQMGTPYRSRRGDPFAARRWSALLAAAAMAGILLSGPGHAVMPRPAGAANGSLIERIAVFGFDDRTRLPEAHRGLQKSIGVLYNNRSRTMCTAFCVAENIVATAAHCVYRTSGERAPNPDDFMFTWPGAGKRDRARIAGSGQRSAAQNVLAGTAELSVRPPIDAARDWALVKLAEPACQGRTLPVRMLTSEEIFEQAAANRLFQVGYHRDFMAWQPVYSSPCQAGRSFGGSDWKRVMRDFTQPSHLILHTCDTGGASSGSPLMIETPAGPEVVAINVGTYMQARVMIEDGEVVHRAKAGPVANTAVGSQAFAGKLEAFRQAVILPSGAPMRALQVELKSRGLYRGPLDGRFGTRLRDAILDYERSVGLTETGLPTAALIKRLEEENSAQRTGSRV